MELKQMRLIFLRHGDTWGKIVMDLDGNVIFEKTGLKLSPEHNNQEYFNNWEIQIKNIPHFNIVQVDRFI
jgi:hypothetical protein